MKKFVLSTLVLFVMTTRAIAADIAVADIDSAIAVSTGTSVISDPLALDTNFNSNQQAINQIVQYGNNSLLVGSTHAGNFAANQHLPNVGFVIPPLTEATVNIPLFSNSAIGSYAAFNENLINNSGATVRWNKSPFSTIDPTEDDSSTGTGQ